MNFIAVHAGAGYHGINYREEYLRVCREACETAMKALKEGKCAVDSVTCAVASLEDDWITNAGFGSNLNTNGIVECDASIMNGSNLNWAAVGSLQGIRNPIVGAKLLLEEQDKVMPLGLVSPNILVGDGAKTWCQSKGCTISENLISEKSKESYIKYKRKLASYINNCDDNLNSNSYEIKHSRLDTVGATCIDSKGNIASAVSSGGITLKMSGRIGQASIYGCGAWAQDNVAVTTSGVGEYLIKTMFAKECSTKLLKCTDGNLVKALNEAFREDFIESPFLNKIDLEDKLAGVLALFYDRESKSTELLWGHSTCSMCIGYMNSSHRHAKALISELPHNSQPGHTWLTEAKSFR